ncbi:hypothetical protein ACRDNQ_07480 [Palleronia sp. KMU-117]|uniref:hypothetical protein n=1 Tax=Palleronia sp. KMU-117 TaxID=3434108 RepID=UPI003D74B998
MDAIADILLIAGAVGAGVYCFVLARRLRRFTDLERGVGGAIAVLSVQVDDMTKALGAAQTSAATTSGTLDALTARAEEAARRLELLVAALHDLPVEGPQTGSAPRARPATPPEPGPGTAAEAAAPTTDGRSTFFLSQRARIKEGAR